MSERLKNTNITSNEDIIDDLTKDLETSLNTNENSTEAGSSGVQDIPGPNTDSTDYNDIKIDYDHNKPDDESQSDTDSIDEEHLKDDEVDLTDDQKAERLATAEQLKLAGNEAFKCAEYEKSIEKYTEGLKLCPLQFDKVRGFLYCNRSAARMKLKLYKKAIKDCTKAIELDESYVKAYLRRASCYESIEKYQDALEDINKVLQISPDLDEAKKSSERLKPIVEAKNEELKTEMLGKLKDLGNMILKPFGLSTENFKMEQDPETKGYKINFKQ